MMNKNNYIKYIFALLLFGSNGIVAQQIDMESTNIVLVRTFIGSILLLTVFYLSKNRIDFKNTDKKSMLYLTISGIAMGCSWMFLYAAYRQIGVGMASLLYYTGPIVVMILSPVIFKERLTIQKCICFAVVLIGIFLLNIQQGKFELKSTGFILGILSAAMYSIMVIANKKADKITGMKNASLQLFISFLTVAVYLLVKGEFLTSLPKAPAQWLWLAFLGLINTGIGCYLYFSSIGGIPVQSVSILGYIEPLSALIFSVVLLKEEFILIQIIGAILILSGAVFSNIKINCKKEKFRLN